MKNKNEKTCVIIKPDGVRQNLIGEIIRRYEIIGLKVTAMKMMSVNPLLARSHYPNAMAKSISKRSARLGKAVKGEDILNHLRGFLLSGKVVALILESKNAIKKAKSITGHTDPARADKGTIRGDLISDSILFANGCSRVLYNLVHASDSTAEAKREIALWFGEDSEQAWFWTKEWQEKEAKAEADIKAGRIQKFLPASQQRRAAKK